MYCTDLREERKKIIKPKTASVQYRRSKKRSQDIYSEKYNHFSISNKNGTITSFDYVPYSELIPIEAIENSKKLGVKKYDDAIYFGELENQLRNGFGIMKYKTGSFYEGSWKNDLRHGRGFEKY